jgi:hypothetical protein
VTELNPADEIRRAADVLEQAATKATDGICPNWIYLAVRHIARNCQVDCPHDDHQGYDQPEWDRYDDSPYLNLATPGVGVLVAQLLRSIADYYEPGPAHPTFVTLAYEAAKAINAAHERTSP